MDSTKFGIVTVLSAFCLHRLHHTYRVPDGIEGETGPLAGIFWPPGRPIDKWAVGTNVRLPDLQLRIFRANLSLFYATRSAYWINVRLKDLNAHQPVL